MAEGLIHIHYCSIQGVLPTEPRDCQFNSLNINDKQTIMKKVTALTILLLTSLLSTSYLLGQSEGEVSSTSLQALDVNLSGEWQMSSTTPRGQRSSEMSILHEGATATAKTDRGKLNMLVEGNTISWSATFNTPQGSMRANFTGTIEGDSFMSGTFQVPDSPMADRKMNWSASRISYDAPDQKKKKKKDKKKKKKDSSS